MRTSRAALVLLAVLAATSVRAGEDEELLREAERMARQQAGDRKSVV